MNRIVPNLIDLEDQSGFLSRENRIMELKQKGENTSIDISRPLTVTMTWTTAADFDLAAAYETKTVQQGLVYFGDHGNPDKFPYITISKDQGVGDRAGNNEEVIHIYNLDEMKYVWLFCWDYGMVKVGQAARFKDSDITLTLADDNDNRISVKLDTVNDGNVCCIATIDNSVAEQAKLINYSQIGTLHGLKRLEQLINIVQQLVI
jgi:tellurite resistance protein TerA